MMKCFSIGYKTKIASQGAVIQQNTILLQNTIVSFFQGFPFFYLKHIFPHILAYVFQLFSGSSFSLKTKSSRTSWLFCTNAFCMLVCLCVILSVSCLMSVCQLISDLKIVLACFRQGIKGERIRSWFTNTPNKQILNGKQTCFYIAEGYYDVFSPNVGKKT